MEDKTYTEDLLNARRDDLTSFFNARITCVALHRDALRVMISHLVAAGWRRPDTMDFNKAIFTQPDIGSAMTAVTWHEHTEEYGDETIYDGEIVILSVRLIQGGLDIRFQHREQGAAGILRAESMDATSEINEIGARWLHLIKWVASTPPKP